MNYKKEHEMSNIPERITDYEKMSFEGIDASLEISLFEYGLIWGKDSKCDIDGEYLFVYGVNSQFNDCNELEFYQFDYSHMTKEDYIELLDDLESDSYYQTIDSNRNQEIENYPYSVYNLISYFGVLDVFGSSYDDYLIEIKNR